MTISSVTFEPPQCLPIPVRAATDHLESVAKRLQLVNREIAGADDRLDRLTARLAQSGETKPGQTSEQHDVTILRTLPGVGTIVAATLLAEAYEALRRRDYQALRCLSGVAPVPRAFRQKPHRRHAPSRRRPAAQCRLPLGPRGNSARPGEPSQIRSSQEARSQPRRALRSIADRRSPSRRRMRHACCRD
ncbi:transposase [Aurantimonas sp. A2-1-M11]|uniref:transposase n=1 Tax=Aurantimonas sp. A2-1-M11 TaxID=3113712 RepID=UPI002F91CFA6